MYYLKETLIVTFVTSLKIWSGSCNLLQNGRNICNLHGCEIVADVHVCANNFLQDKLSENLRVIVKGSKS